MLWRRMAALAAIGVLVVLCAPSRASAACIAPDGACYEFDEATCQLVGGVYLGNKLACDGMMTADEIGAGTGACCIGDTAACVEDVTAMECAALGGVYQNDNSTCTDRVCEGACCLRDGEGTCLPQLTEFECLSQLGVYKGNGIGCFNGQCDRFAGSCCLPDGTCFDDMTIDDCEGAGGVFQGFDTTCSAGSCLGACCFDDGTCIEGESQDSCFGAGGDFQGWGAGCPGGECRRVWQAQTGLELTPVDTTLNFLKFDTKNGTRQLTRVIVRMNGKILAVMITTNDNDVNIANTAVQIVEVSMSMSIGGGLFVPPIYPAFLFTSLVDPSDPSFLPPLVCDPNQLEPKDSCDYGSTTSFTSGMPLMWGGLAEADSVSNPADLGGFELPVDDPGWSDPNCSPGRCFDVQVLGNSEFSPSQGNFDFDTTEVAQYFVEVIYEWEPLGACCICDGVCIGVTTQEACNEEAQFVSWHEGMTCDDVTCPPEPNVDIVSCPGEPPLVTEVCPGEQDIPFCAEVLNIDDIMDPDTGYGIGADPPLDLTPIYTWEIMGDATFCDGSTFQMGAELDQVCVDAVDITPNCSGQFTLTVTVQIGNCLDTTTYVVDVIDDTPPVIVDCVDDVSVECPDDVPDVITTITGFLSLGGDVSDNCTDVDDLVVSLVSETSDGATCPETITRVYRVTDLCGNFSDCSQTITVDDETPPVITCPPNVSVECDESTDPSNTGFAGATDNCDPDVDVTFGDVTIPGDCPEAFTIERTWTATDDCGNVDTCVQIITVDDTTPPVITCPPNVSLECDESTDPADTGFASATDNCDTDVTVTFNDVTIPGDCPEAFTIERTWTATDDCGNVDTCVQIITVDDTTPPVITCPPNVSVECDESTDPADTGFASATDNCDTDVTVTFEDVTTPGGCPQAFTIERTWTATDDCGNVDTCVQIITVDDTTPPVITCPPNATVECDESTDPSNLGFASATDNCDLDVDVTFEDVTTPGGCPQAFTIERTWTATDDCGNVDTCVQIITVDDTTPPVITCPPNVTVECDESTDPADTGFAGAVDNCDTDVTVTFNDVTTPGDCPQSITIERTWTATDDCGNVDTCVQIITVDDTTPPVITCPDDLDLECDDPIPAPATTPAEFVAQGGSASDNCAPLDDLTVTLLSEESDGGTCPETITRTYEVCDPCGNCSTCVQIITIDDETPPDITCPTDLLLECDDPIPSPATTPAEFVAQGGTLDDNCADDGDLTVTLIDESSNGACPEVITRTYEVCDPCGNCTTCEQTITINDTTDPMIACPDDLALECDEAVPPAASTVDEFLGQGGSVSDNCSDIDDLDLTLVSESSDGATCPETITRVYRVTDLCGNFEECTQLIVIDDTTPPVVTCPDDLLNQNCTGGLPPAATTFTEFVLQGGTASDNCTAQSNLTLTWLGDVSDGGDCPEVFTRTYEICDECGNCATCEQLIECVPPSACCFCDGTCLNLTEEECMERMNQDVYDVYAVSFTPCVECDELTEPCEPVGACCLPGGGCAELTEAECIAAGGTPFTDLGLPACSTCDDVDCDIPRYGCQEKGSLLIFSKVEIRWTANGELVQDTFIQITNDLNRDVRVQMYFINGDEPLPFDPDTGERAHSGWNWVDNEITLTADQPTYWSALTGQPSTGFVSPWEVLDPGDPPGRPDPEGSDERVLRGFIIAWAVDSENRQIKWNHLAGKATLVNYARNLAWEYNPCAFQVVDDALATGSVVGTPGVINLNGTDYTAPADFQLMQFQSSGATAYSTPDFAVDTDTDVTLHPVSADLRQETEGPPIVKADFALWDQNERRVSTHRCITCWDQRRVSLYESPIFQRPFFQTDFGKARIDGLGSQVCPGSEPHALLGLQARLINIEGVQTAASGTNMFGVGYEPATILYDVLNDPPPTMPINPTEEQLDAFVEYWLNLADESSPVASRE